MGGLLHSPERVFSCWDAMVIKPSRFSFIQSVRAMVKTQRPAFSSPLTHVYTHTTNQPKLPPFDHRLRYPTEINGQPLPAYIDWLRISSVVTLTCVRLYPSINQSIHPSIPPSIHLPISCPSFPLSFRFLGGRVVEAIHDGWTDHIPPQIPAAMGHKAQRIKNPPRPHTQLRPVPLPPLRPDQHRPARRPPNRRAALQVGAGVRKRDGDGGRRTHGCMHQTHTHTHPSLSGAACLSTHRKFNNNNNSEARILALADAACLSTYPLTKITIKMTTVRPKSWPSPRYLSSATPSIT